MESGYTNRAEIGPRQIIGPHGHIWQPVARDPSGAYQFCKLCNARRHAPVATGVPALRGDWLRGEPWDVEAKAATPEQDPPPDPEDEDEGGESEEDGEDESDEDEAKATPRRRNVRQPRQPRVTRAHARS